MGPARCPRKLPEMKSCGGSGCCSISQVGCPSEIGNGPPASKISPGGERLFYGVLLDCPHFAMYSFVLLKIHGQDWVVYFLAILSEEWLRVVDARPSSP